jgi:hypothetical protein
MGAEANYAEFGKLASVDLQHFELMLGVYGSK